MKKIVTTELIFSELYKVENEESDYHVTGRITIVNGKIETIVIHNHQNRFRTTKLESSNLVELYSSPEFVALLKLLKQMQDALIEMGLMEKV